MRHRGHRRRVFLRGLSAAAVTGSLAGRIRAAGAEPPPETSRLRLLKTGSLCWAPQYVAETLLRDEGFADIIYPTLPGGSISEMLSAGQADLSMNFIGPNLIRVDLGDPVVFLAGAHVGCFEVFGTERVRKIRDLKGRTAAVSSLRGAEHVFFSSIAAHVGLDPRKDIHWVTHPGDESMKLLAEGKVDAFLGFPPQPQELRAQKVGHVVVNSATDRPWSQYFCCIVTGSREFVRKNPIATKRALRAILKSADLCAQEPERVARYLVDKGYAGRYDYALQVMKELPYGKWREYDPEDTIRFYALRLHEVGMIKASPQRIIAQHTDWRFLHELKKELKG
jgi:NitT/TauT family transport system substrate-binding protein